MLTTNKSILKWENNEWIVTDTPIAFYLGLNDIYNQSIHESFILSNLNISVEDKETGRIEYIKRNHILEWFLSTSQNDEMYPTILDYKQKIKEIFGSQTLVKEMICLVITTIDFLLPEYCEMDMDEDNILDLYVYYGFYRDNTGKLRYEIAYDLDGFKEFKIIKFSIEIEWIVNSDLITKVKQLMGSTEHLN